MLRPAQPLCLLTALFVALICLSLSGCSNRKDFTDAEFKQVAVGMVEPDVLKLLGTPQRTNHNPGNITVHFWVANGTEYAVAFEGGKVLNTGLMRLKQ